MPDTKTSDLAEADPAGTAIVFPVVQDGVNKKVTRTATGAGVVNVFSLTTTLTDAQIKALPTTAFELVPAPGAGKTVHFLSGFGLCDFMGGIYEGSDENALVVSGMYLAVGNLQASLAVNDPSWIFADASDVWSIQLAQYVQQDAGVSTGTNGYVLSDFENQPLALILNPVVAGNLTGGNAANTMKVTVLYTIIDV